MSFANVLPPSQVRTGGVVGTQIRSIYCAISRTQEGRARIYARERESLRTWRNGSSEGPAEPTDADQTRLSGGTHIMQEVVPCGSLVLMFWCAVFKYVGFPSDNVNLLTNSLDLLSLSLLLDSRGVAVVLE